MEYTTLGEAGMSVSRICLGCMNFAEESDGWGIDREASTEIVGVTSVDHLEDTVEAVDVSLSSSDVDYLEEPYEPKPVSGPPIRPSVRSVHSTIVESTVEFARWI